MNLYDKRKNNDRLSGLAQALNARSNTNVAITPFQPVGTQNGGDSTSALGGAGDLLTGGIKLYEGIQNSGLFKDGSSLGGSSAISDSINSNIFGGGSSGSAITDAINGVGSESALSGAISSEAPSATSLGSIGGGSGLGSAPWGMIANTGKSLYNNITGKTPKEYSDVEQSTIYPLQGAANGFSYGGPWGALGGALYGLGYSFKDELGLDDSNFLTQMLFPIGMGDGGGLRINGNSVLDIF